MKKHREDIAIIGAGLAGLTAAQHLKQRANVTLFEKSRGVSGRIATRRANEYAFDHGAQFFKVKTQAFDDFIQPMLKQGIIETWHARFAEIENQAIINTRNWDNTLPHYVGVPGMSAIGKFLSEGLTIHLNTCIKKVSRHEDKWLLYTNDDNCLGQFDWIVLTPPAAQTKALLSGSFPEYDKMLKTEMAACFSLMLGFEEPVNLPYDAALVRGNDISWISVNNTKPRRARGYSLLIHSTNAWASQHINDPKSQVQAYLIAQASKITGLELSSANHQNIHAWRYANITKQQGDTHLLNVNQKLAICGDWFIQGRIEAAFTSGFDCATNLGEALSGIKMK